MSSANSKISMDLWTSAPQVKAGLGYCRRLSSEAASCYTKSTVDLSLQGFSSSGSLPPTVRPVSLAHERTTGQLLFPMSDCQAVVRASRLFCMKMVLAMTGVKLLNLILVTSLLGHFTVESANCSVGDRNALLQFKSGLADPYGVLSDWDTNPNCCTWLQTRQYRMTTCNSVGRVTSLTMGSALEYKPGPVYFKVNGGEYGPSLSALTFLEKLDLQTIYSGGAIIPSGWAALTRLSNVTLDVLVAGPLPRPVVKAWPLKSLVLTNNDLNGTLPVELCKSTLRTLKVSGNSFTGQIPSCLSRFPASSFNDSSTGPSGNEGLCGAPLPACSS